MIWLSYLVIILQIQVVANGQAETFSLCMPCNRTLAFPKFSFGKVFVFGLKHPLFLYFCNCQNETGTIISPFPQSPVICLQLSF